MFGASAWPSDCMTENAQSAAVAVAFEAARKSTAHDIVLSTHPLSSGYRQRLEARLGAPAEYLLVSGLRALGVGGAIKRLRRLAPARLIIAYEDEDSRVILPVLECIAATTRAKSLAIADPALTIESVSLGSIARSSVRLAWATVQCFRAKQRAASEVSQLLAAPALAPKPVVDRDVLYLNTNLWFGVKAGGSVGHIAGVANALQKCGWAVRYAAVSDSPVIDRSVERRLFEPPHAHGLPPELNHYRFSQSALTQARRMVAERRPSFVYQRMSIGNYTGAQLSRMLSIPLVLEYNGSEVWTARHWGRRMIYEDLAIDAERASLRHASLVVTVSEALADQLRDAGVPDDRIVWYPNCVDASVFDPARFTGSATAQVRARHGLVPEDIVISFIGTFGKWHGVDVLAKAIRQLVDTDRAWLDQYRVRFLIVGDGQLMSAVRELLSGPDDHRYAVLTGLVPQQEAPGYLAAADAVVSPHVPNPDGTPFFGSPTKLFEYMIMGKAIVASDLDQIGEVLADSVRVSALPGTLPMPDDKRLAVLARPDSVDDLVRGIRFVVNSPEWRRTLGENARAEALSKYLWEHHVRAILDRLPGAT